MKDAHVYRPDSVIFDLEETVAENQKDAARFSLYHILKAVDYGEVERIARINGLDTPYWREDIRASVAGGADAIRIAKCESARDVREVEDATAAAEAEFGREAGATLLMAAIGSPRGLQNAQAICEASPRLLGVAISGGEYRKCMQTKYHPSGADMLVARGMLLIAARAAGIQCFDTAFTDLEDTEGFKAEVILIQEMGFDGKSIVSPSQIKVVHEIFSPSRHEFREAERIVQAVRDHTEEGIDVFSLDGKLLDIDFGPGTEKLPAKAKVSGLY
jgi:citrate lyase subunit beta/citryl-CoA lyase